MLAHPHGSTILRAAVARNLMCRPLLSDIPDPQLLITGGCHHHRSIGAPRQALHDVGVLEGQVGVSSSDIPELDSIVAGGGSEDVLRGGIEQDLSNLACVPGELADRGDILWLLGVGVQREALWDLPYEDLPIVGSGCDNAIVEGVPMRKGQLELLRKGNSPLLPVSIENRRGVSSEQWDLFRQTTFLIQWDDGECTAAAGLPVYGEVFGVNLSSSISSPKSIVSAWRPYLHQIRVPGIAADMQVIKGRFLPRWLPKYVS